MFKQDEKPDQSFLQRIGAKHFLLIYDSEIITDI